MKIDTSKLEKLIRNNVIIGFSIEDDELVILAIDIDKLKKYIDTLSRQGINVKIIKLSEYPSILNT